MPHLRRRAQALREPFGKAGLIVAALALVFAMLGGAYAATNGGGKATASAKAKRGPRGPKGPAGPAGPAGANGTNGKDGAQGPEGAEGPEGPQGKAGTSGTSGTNGKNVVIGTATVGECPEGGSTVEVEGTPASKKAVCNGEEGGQGPEGEPWTAGGTLPSGATETGAWSVGPVHAGQVATPALSLTIPLATPMENVPGCGEEGEPPCQIIYLPFGEGETTECPGTAEAPEAAPGEMCIYTLGGANTFLYIAGNIRSTVSGIFPFFIVTGEEGEEFNANGTWAVTAP